MSIINETELITSLELFREIFGKVNCDDPENHKCRDIMVLQLMKTYCVEFLRGMIKVGERNNNCYDITDFNNHIIDAEDEFNKLMLKVVDAVENNRRRFK